MRGPLCDLRFLPRIWWRFLLPAPAILVSHLAHPSNRACLQTCLRCVASLWPLLRVRPPVPSLPWAGHVSLCNNSVANYIFGFGVQVDTQTKL